MVSVHVITAFFVSLLSLTTVAAPPARSGPTAFEQKITSLFSAKGGERERLLKLYAAYWDYAMVESPETATYTGYPGQNGRWSNLALPEIERHKREMAALAKLLGRVNRGQLKSPDRLYFDLFKRDIDEEVEGYRFPNEFLVMDQLTGVVQYPAQTIAMMPTTSAKAYEDILKRLNALPALVEQNIDLLREGAKRGVTPPKLMLREVPDQIKTLATEDTQTAAFLAPFRNIPATFSESIAAGMKEDAKEIYLKKVVPAYLKLHDFVTKEYLPRCREGIAWKDLPNGEAWYLYRVKKNTTTTLTPKQIHEIGLSEVKRLRGEMEKVIAQTGFKGTFAEFLNFIRKDSQFFYTKTEDLLKDYRDIAKRADPELAKLFGKLPRLPYGVVPVPTYTEKSGPTAYYEPGAGTAGRAGNFFANTYDLKSRPKWEMEALTFHEAVPGHHLQLSLASEMENVPEFRKWAGYTAFVEGWGLYSESLGTEMGFYKDPYSHFGQLTYEIWRAIRLVVDTGMHAFSWPREKAIAFFEENAGKADHDIVVEVDRYIVWAGQALSYKLGELKIKELRALATNELGSAFDIRRFHDTVLEMGTVPLDVLETHVKEWITENKVTRK